MHAPVDVQSNRPVVVDGTPAIVDMYRHRRAYFWLTVLVPVGITFAWLIFAPIDLGVRLLLCFFVWAPSFLAFAVPYMRGMERLFMIRMAERYEFEYVGKVPVPFGVPYFGHGTVHRLRNAIIGTWKDIPLLVATHAYIDRENDPQTATVCVVTLPDVVAQRFAGISCRGKGTRENGNLVERLVDDERREQFESLQFEAPYDVTTVAAQDPIAVRELFTPVFLEWLTATGAVYWEQRGSQLISWGPYSYFDERTFTTLLDNVVEVTQRYLQEWR